MSHFIQLSSTTTMEQNTNQDMTNLRTMFLTILDFDLENPSNFDHPFCFTYRVLLKLNPDTDEYKYLLFNCLFGIIECMYMLKNINNSEYEKWKIRLAKNKNSVGIYGDIYELYIHWSLERKKISFLKSERPDFIINWNESNIFIECGSTQFDFDKTPNEKEVFRKLKSAIRSNFTSGYLNNSTALFVDITNLIFHLPNFDAGVLSRALNAVDVELERNPSDTLNKPGAITFMNFELIKNSSGQNYACNVTGSFLNPNADSNLKSFLEENFVHGIQKPIVIKPKFHH